MSPIAGTPEITLPSRCLFFLLDDGAKNTNNYVQVGEITFRSKITQHEEPLPISVSVVAAPGKITCHSST